MDVITGNTMIEIQLEIDEWDVMFCIIPGKGKIQLSKSDSETIKKILGINNDRT